jgi:hypothetical protein
MFNIEEKLSNDEELNQNNVKITKLVKELRDVLYHHINRYMELLPKEISEQEKDQVKPIMLHDLSQTIAKHLCIDTMAKINPEWLEEAMNSIADSEEFQQFCDEKSSTNNKISSFGSNRIN